LKEKGGQQERPVGREKGGKGGGFQGKKVKAEKVGSKETRGSCARKTRVAEQNRGRIKKTEAWIPTLPKEQPDMNAREARIRAN
jgi:hypothetical protein